MNYKFQIYLSCYNEAETISRNIDELFMTFIADDCSFEIIVVDNNSTDSTQSKVLEQTQKYDNLRIITLSENLGYSGSVLTAIRDATADYIVVMDGDFQFPPIYIRPLYEKLLEGNEIVFIHRTKLIGSLNRKIASRFFVVVLWLVMRFPHTDLNGGMRIMTRNFYRQVLDLPRGRLANVALWWYAKKNSFPYDFIKVEPRERDGGKSSIPWNQPLRLFIESLRELKSIKRRFW